VELKMKLENRKYGTRMGLDRFGSRPPAFWTCVLCFALLPVLLLTSLLGVASASSTGEAVEGLRLGAPAIPVDANSPQQRALWRAEISAAPGLGDGQTKNELKRMIEKVRSVTFEPRRHVAEPEPAPFKIRPVEPAVPASDVKPDAQDKQKPAVPKPRPPFEPITEKTLQMVRKLSENPGKVADPFTLGETLFLSGNLEEASVFYTEALDRTRADDVDPSGNRAWILFQIGNCLRNSDKPAAAKMYAQLITEYPDSPWSQMAQTQARLIDWYLKDKPHKLIAEREHAGSE